MISLDLVPSWTVGGLALTDYPYSVDAESTVDIGEPEMVVESVASLQADGDLQRVSRHGNREYILQVYVEGPTLGELSLSEARLRTELQRSGLSLTHDPGDGLTPASVYEVQTARLTPQRDDLHESHLIRKFTLTLTCGPWARSAELTTVPALVPPGSPVVFSIPKDDVTASGTDSASLIDFGSYLQASVTATHPGPTGVSLTYLFASTPMSSTRYVQVETSGPPVGAQTFNVRVDGVWLRLAPVATLAQSGGTTLSYLDVAGVGAAASGVRVSRSNSFPSTVTLNVHDLKRTNVLSQVSPRQSSRNVEVGGTERTPCSIAVTSTGVDLGHTLVGTWPESLVGFSPPLRRWRISGNTSILDSSAISDRREPIGPTAVEFGIPAGSIPTGIYQIVARLRSSTTGALGVYWEAITRVEGVPLDGFDSDFIDVVFPAADQWILADLGVVELPVVAATAADVVIGINGADISYDEVWLFPVGDDCALTIVDAEGSSRMWLDSPDHISPVPRVRVGNTDTRSNAHSPGLRLKAMGAHTMVPGTTTVFVASATDNPIVSATYHKRWHSNAAE